MSGHAPDHRVQPSCRDCGTQAVFVVEYQRWYCPRCQNYLPMEQAVAPPGTHGQYQQVPVQPQYAQPVQPQYAQQQYGQPHHTQPVYAHQPQQALPNEDVAKAKIQSAIGLRNESDSILSTLWPALIITLQILVIIIVLAGMFILLDNLINEAIMDPYAGDLPSDFLLLIMLGFILQVILTIMQSYLIYRLVLRMDDHFRRDHLLRQGILEYLDARSMSQKTDINVERWTMNTINMTSSAKERKKGAITWAMIVGILSFIPLIGIFFLLYVLHFLIDDLINHDFNQNNFKGQLNMALAKLGKPMVHPGAYTNVPRRSTGLYVILTIITLGFFLPYWWYVVIRDWNSHFQNQWKFEDETFSILRQD